MVNQKMKIKNQNNKKIKVIIIIIKNQLWQCGQILLNYLNQDYVNQDGENQIYCNGLNILKMEDKFYHSLYFVKKVHKFNNIIYFKNYDQYRFG